MRQSYELHGKDVPGQMDLPVEGTAYRAAGM